MQIWPANTQCPDPRFPEFSELLNKASYHHADDSGKEWGTAREYVARAAEVAIEADYPYWAMERMFSEIKPLVTWTQFMHAYITKLKEKK